MVKFVGKSTFGTTPPPPTEVSFRSPNLLNHQELQETMTGAPPFMYYRTTKRYLAGVQPCPNAPWDWNIYLHLPYIYAIHVGKIFQSHGAYGLGFLGSNFPFYGGPTGRPLNDRPARRNELMALLGDLPPDDLDSYLKNAFVLVKARKLEDMFCFFSLLVFLLLVSLVAVCVCVCLFVCLVGCLFVCLFGCLVVCLFVCLFACVCVCVFVVTCCCCCCCCCLHSFGSFLAAMVVGRTFTYTFFFLKRWNPRKAEEHWIEMRLSGKYLVSGPLPSNSHHQDYYISSRGSL